MLCLIFVLLAGKWSWEVPAFPKSRKIIAGCKLILQHMLWLVVLPSVYNGIAVTQARPRQLAGGAWPQQGAFCSNTAKWLNTPTSPIPFARIFIFINDKSVFPSYLTGFVQAAFSH